MKRRRDEDRQQLGARKTAGEGLMQTRSRDDERIGDENQRCSERDAEKKIAKAEPRRNKKSEPPPPALNDSNRERCRGDDRKEARPLRIDERAECDEDRKVHRHEERERREKQCP